MSTVSKEILQERQPFDVAWRTIDGLEIRYATDGKGDEKIVLFSPWPESILAFTPVWGGLTVQFEVLAIDLAALAPHLASIEVPVAIVVGRNDPYGLARDAALLRERLPHARLDVLEAGHCVWEERAPEFESIVTQWVSAGYQG